MTQQFASIMYIVYFCQLLPNTKGSIKDCSYFLLYPLDTCRLLNDLKHTTNNMMYDFFTEIKFMKCKTTKKREKFDSALFITHSNKFARNLEDHVSPPQTCVMIVATVLQLFL